MPRTRGFTIIELMVVVTIIVVLLSLLIPTMGQAMYQSKLAICATQLKTATASVITYTFDYQNRYPYRNIEDRVPNNDYLGWINPQALSRPQSTVPYDMRPVLRTFMAYNDFLQCPLTDKIDLEQEFSTLESEGAAAVQGQQRVSLEASYVMFWSWQYNVPQRNRVFVDQEDPGNSQPQQQTSGQYKGGGMFKRGETFEWQNSLGTHEYRVLMGDIDLRYPESSQVSHPDRDPEKTHLITAEDVIIFGFPGSVSRWMVRTDRERGVVDNNFAFDDNSVHRYNNVPNMIRDSKGLWLGNDRSGDEEGRMALVPLQFDDTRNQPHKDRLQIPKR